MLDSQAKEKHPPPPPDIENRVSNLTCLVHVRFNLKETSARLNGMSPTDVSNKDTTFSAVTKFLRKAGPTCILIWE